MVGSSLPSAGQDLGDDVLGFLDPSMTRYGRSGQGRVDTGPLVEPGLFGDELGREPPVHLVPGVGDLRGDGVPEDLTGGGEDVVTDDGALLGSDARRDVLKAMRSITRWKEDAVGRALGAGGAVQRVEILPFHQMGENKWKALGLPYALADNQPPSNDLVDRLRAQFRDRGLTVLAASGVAAAQSPGQHVDEWRES